jgi:hypothetical protein
MKTMLRAAIMVFGVGSSAAYGGDRYAAATLFTSTAGEQSNPSAAPPRQPAITMPNGAVARGSMTNSRRGTWLFPPAPDSGEH